jgi:cell division protein FtsL
MAEIITAIIGAAASVAAVLISARATTAKVQQSLATSQAVTDQKISTLQEDLKELKDEVKEHNSYGRRLPVIEEQLQDVFRRLKRIEDRQD